MDNQDIIIEIATGFSPSPSGRYFTDGPWSGEKFRIYYLMSAIQKARYAEKKVIISLDGLISCSASFLDEAFGGLFLHDPTNFNYSNIIEVKYSKPHLKRYHDAILRYLNAPYVNEK